MHSPRRRPRELCEPYASTSGGGGLERNETAELEPTAKQHRRLTSHHRSSEPASSGSNRGSHLLGWTASSEAHAR
jgi:hypothetical protein